MRKSQSRLGVLAVLFATASTLIMPSVFGYPANDKQFARRDPIAFTNVSVIPMDHEAVLDGYTVLVDGNRIVQVAPSAQVTLPAGCIVIDARGKYLMPGLTDSHVHLDSTVASRPNFGDGPLYLACGVTTVFNLRGGTEQLRWRSEIEQGKIIAPTLYTSGEFINEPRVHTPAEVEKEVAAQKAAGYDILKHHQVVDDRTRTYLTTTGLSLPALMSLTEAARREGMPLIGHGPESLEMDAVLQSHLSLAHIGEFYHLYFLPGPRFQRYLPLALVSLLIIALILAGWGIAALVRVLGRKRAPESAENQRRIRTWAAWFFVLMLGIAILRLLVTPGAPLAGNVPVLAILTLLCGLLTCMAAAVAAWTLRGWSASGWSWFLRVQNAALALAALALVFALVVFWVPTAWRASDVGIRRLARECRTSGIQVQSTLVIYHTLLRVVRPEGNEYLNDSAIPYLPEPARTAWRNPPQSLPPLMSALFGHYPEFTRKVALALYREGVPIMAGTDAMGALLISPGTSLQNEILILARAGLKPYEVLRTATVNPATFLNKKDEFGMIAPGMRADMLLVSGNPLQDLSVIREPLGVMVRGMWLPKERLHSMLEEIRVPEPAPAASGKRQG